MLVQTHAQPDCVIAGQTQSVPALRNVLHRFVIAEHTQFKPAQTDTLRKSVVAGLTR